MAPSMLYSWVEVDKRYKRVLSHRYIKLLENKNIVFGGNYKACGTWKYVHVEGIGGVFFLEFSASNSWYKVKHILQQVTEEAAVYQLLPAGCDIVPGIGPVTGLWDDSSVDHKNYNIILMQKIELDLLLDDVEGGDDDSLEMALVSVS